ncbi:response regulator transcription factor [Flavobacterium antarcticum]|uniref:DNA-binding response regulator n=1 Tax=Flavobacterium antarcticum TaxID=271155 RepID=UPI0003B747E1|nr:response regulator transcription factor [Flavobacterium antarcticum]
MSKSILIVDDHKVTTLGYKSILENNDRDLTFIFTTITSLQQAYELITASTNHNTFDIVFLDRSMPPFEEKKIVLGEDLIPFIRKSNENAKVIILTSLTEKFSIYDVIYKNRPDGMMIKSEIDDENLIECVQSILNNQSYHSILVREALKEEIITKGHFDTIDRQIITLLSQGFRNATIADKLGLSASAVEKRKSRIKDYLNVTGNDEEIIKESRRLGYI